MEADDDIRIQSRTTTNKTKNRNRKSRQGAYEEVEGGQGAGEGKREGACTKPLGLSVFKVFDLTGDWGKQRLKAREDGRHSAGASPSLRE